jgi:acyl dehydratase
VEGYLEDFVVGQRMTTRGRTVSESDIVTFAGLAGDHTPIHVDETFARTTQHGTRIAHGPLILSMGLGLFTQLGCFDKHLVGLLGLDWKVKLPVKIGDTIKTNITVLEARPTSKPGNGVVRFQVEVVNQNGQVVHEGIMAVMVKSRGGAIRASA